MTPVDKVVDALQRYDCEPRRSGEGWSARCPAHDDRNPSLTVGEGDDVPVLLCCFAGCSYNDILDALKLDRKDLCRQGTDGDEPANDTYDYTDEHGNALFQIVRKGNGKFTARRPDGTGGWIPKTHGVRRVLYRLPRVIAAVGAGEWVFKVEGEKDVHTAERLGFTATTNPYGAKSWRDEYAAFFEGARVVVIPDNDDLGRKHVAQVSSSLDGVASEVVVLAPLVEKEGGDLTDWVATQPDYETASAALMELAERTRTDRAESRVEWSEPVPLDVAKLPVFPVDVLPAWLGDSVAALAVATQTPVDLGGMLSLAVVSVAAARMIVAEVRHGWREPINVYVVTALPSGNRKTAVYVAMSRPLYDEEARLVDDAKAVIDDARTEKQIAQDKAAEAIKAASKPTKASPAADESDRAGLVDDAKRAVRVAEGIEVPQSPRLLADDATPEALVTLLADHGSRMAVFSDEGGLFSQMRGRYNRNIPNLDVYLKGHVGSWYRVDRQSRAAQMLDRIALTVALTVQPGVLRDAAREPALRDRGLFARFFYSVPASPIGHRQINPPPVPDRVEDTYNRNVRALVESFAGKTDPVILRFTEQAGQAVIEFEAWLEPQLAPDGSYGEYVDWAGKLSGGIARIAGLLHLASHVDRGRVDDGWRDPVSVETVNAARTIGRYLIDHALAAFDIMGEDETLANARAVHGWLRRTRAETFTRRDCQRAIPSRFPTAEAVDPVLDLLIDTGWIRRLTASPPSGPGRPPSPTYETHPSLHKDTGPRSPESSKTIDTIDTNPGSGEPISDSVDSVNSFRPSGDDFDEFTEADLDGQPLVVAELARRREGLVEKRPGGLVMRPRAGPDDAHDVPESWKYFSDPIGSCAKCHEACRSTLNGVPMHETCRESPPAPSVETVTAVSVPAGIGGDNNDNERDVAPLDDRFTVLDEPGECRTCGLQCDTADKWGPTHTNPDCADAEPY